MNDHPDWGRNDWLAAAQLRATSLSHQTAPTGHINPTQLARVLQALAQAITHQNPDGCDPQRNAHKHLHEAINHLRQEAQQ